MPAPKSRFTEIAITGLAHVDADVVVTTESIDDQLSATLDRFEMPRGLVQSLTGIDERRFWREGMAPSDAAVLAAEKLIGESDVDPDTIGLLINTSVCRDHLEPSTASIAQGKLGLGRDCMNFDVGSACLGFLSGANIASSMIERGDIEHALIVDGEDCRQVVEATVARLQRSDIDEETFREQFACLTLGSAGVAILLSRADSNVDAPRYLGGLSVSATEHHELSVGGPKEGRTQAHALLMAGLDLAKDGWQEAQAEFDWASDSIAMVAAHQVSRVHTDMLIDRLGFDGDKVPRTYPTFGNTGPAAVPTVLSKEVDAGRLKTGDRVILTGMGSGLNAMAIEVVW
ncbi:MAG: 3-oxoacyl-ACP synthase III [Acidimicrobiales bacterium]|nr:3-oxoacyl-ACP synthase III [Acidimicrobiales bacterium]